MTNRCRVCRRHGTELCWWCQAMCRRKHRYPTYWQAQKVLHQQRSHTWDDPTLGVYQCKATSDGHYHIGHATGRSADRLRKRAEKLRRRALLSDLDGS